MTSQIDYASVAPEAARPLLDLGQLITASGLDPKLLALVQIRASQLNGCGFCLVLHTMEAEALGETRERLATIAAWRDASWYDARERAALEWTERLTALAGAPPPETLRARVREHFAERELVYLTLAIAAINAWNRLNVAFGTSPERAEAVFRMLHGDAAAR